jgi:hypothetical protein
MAATTTNVVCVGAVYIDTIWTYVTHDKKILFPSGLCTILNSNSSTWQISKPPFKPTNITQRPLLPPRRYQTPRPKSHPAPGRQHRKHPRSTLRHPSPHAHREYDRAPPHLRPPGRAVTGYGTDPRLPSRCERGRTLPRRPPECRIQHDHPESTR